MESSKSTADHPFQTYLNQQVPVHRPEEEPEDSLRLLQTEELAIIINEHQKWLDSDNYQKWSRAPSDEKSQYGLGRADLSRCDLQRVTLENVNLRGAVLWQTNFRGASLKHVNLEKADLWGANFEEANLYRALLSHADAWDANFHGANLYGADLRNAAMGGANFQKANLADAQLQQAFLAECNFQGATITRGNFFRADLRETFFEESKLTGTSFRETNLQNAKFLRSSGLQESSLAGAVLSDTALPKESEHFRQSLRFLEETSKTITKGLLFLLGVCAYAVLTVWSTSDAQLLTNSSGEGLPIIYAGVPVTSFILGTTFFLLVVYCYWHLYAETVWRGIAQLPAIFPNGRSVDQELFSWVVNGFIRPNVFHLRKLRSPFTSIQHFLLRVLIWWVVPLCIAVFWLVLLPLHDWKITGLQILCVVLAVFGAAVFQQRSRKILRGERHADNLLHVQTLSMKGWWKCVAVGLITLVSVAIISDGTINGMPIKANASLRGTDSVTFNFVKEALEKQVQRPGTLSTHRTLVPLLLPFIGGRAFADISHLDVSERTGNTSIQGNGQALKELVRGPQLQGANLQYLSGMNAFIKNADLEEADLKGADLTSVNLESSSLVRASLRKATLRRANLRNSNLFEANLQSADLDVADLQQANFFEANLRAASLVGANLQKGTFVGANLEKAALNAANLSDANMGRVNLKQASLRAANLTKANFVEAKLDHSNLEGANLRGTNFARASLKQAQLQGVDLSMAKNLSQSQLNQACLNSKTKLPKHLIRPRACNS